MDTPTAQLILGVDGTTDPEHLRQRFESLRDGLERQLADAEPARKEDVRRQLAALGEAYAALTAAVPGTPAAGQVPPAAEVPTPAGTAPRRGRTLLVAGVALAAAAGVWGWNQHVQAERARSEAARQEILGSIRALPDEAAEEACQRCEQAVSAAIAGPAAAFRPEIETAWQQRRTAIAAIWARLDAELQRDLAAATAGADALVAEVAAARAKVATIPAPEGAADARRDYLLARRAAWGAYATWLDAKVAEPGLRAALAAAGTAPAAHARAEARRQVEIARTALAAWPAARAATRRQLVEVPLVDAAVAHATVAEWQAWQLADEGGESAAAILGDRLAVLDRQTPVPPEARVQVAVLAALVPQDARLPAWRTKLDRVQALQRELAVLDEADSLPARWRSCEAPLATLAGLVGVEADPVARWTREQAARRTAYEAARTTLVRLDATPPPTAEDGETLDRALEGYAKLVPPDDAELKRWSALLDPIAAASRYRRALAATAYEEQERLLEASARGGNLDAGARMVWLARWGAMGRIDPRNPLIAPWAEAASEHLGLTSRQIHGEFLANWATRHRGDDIDVNAEMLRARVSIESAPLSNPILLNEAAWLWKSVTPADEARSRELRSAAAATAEAAAAALATGGDLLRALRVLDTGADAADEIADKALAGRLFGQAVAVAERAGWADLACWYAVAQAGRAEAEAAGPLYVQALKRCLDAADGYLRAGDAAKQVYCLLEAAYVQRSDTRQDGSWDAARELYARVAAIQGARGNVAEQARLTALQASCLSPKNNPAGDWRKADELYGTSVQQYRRAGLLVRVAEQLANRAACHRPNDNPAGNWDTCASLYGEAMGAAQEGGDRRAMLSYSQRQARCLSDACDIGKLDRWQAAASAYGATATLAAALKDGDTQSHCLHQQAYHLDPARNPLGDHDRVSEIYRQAIALAIENKRAPDQIAVSYNNLAESLRPDAEKAGKRASWTEAGTAFAASAEWYGKAGMAVDQGEALSLQSLCVFPPVNPAGDYARCSQLLSQAVPLLRNAPQAKKRLGFAVQRQAMCRSPAWNRAGSWQESVPLFAEAAAILADAGDKYEAANCLAHQARALLPSNNPAGSWARALELYTRAGEIYLAEKKPRDEAVCLHQQAYCLIEADSSRMTPQARELFRRSADLSRANGDESQAKLSESWIK